MYVNKKYIGRFEELKCDQRGYCNLFWNHRFSAPAVKLTEQASAKMLTGPLVH